MENIETKQDIMKYPKLYDSLNLYITTDSYYLQPIENESILLYIDRVNQEMSLQTNNGQIPSSANMLIIFGVLGRIRLIAGFYLVVITDRKLVGQICGHDIWRIENIELIPFCKTLLHLNQEQDEMNKIYLSMMKSIFGTPYFYCSYTYDLTHTLQRLHCVPADFVTIPFYKRAESRFVWNNYLLDQFCIFVDLHKFCIPIIHGFISINPYSFTYENSKECKAFTWTIVARRNRFRAGTRLFKRGIDFHGNVANFVETEQIIEFEGVQCSFVQIRGSVPLYWHQYPNLKLKPKIGIIPTENHVEACARHLLEITEKYNYIVLINLIDHKGREAQLEKKFRSIVEEIAMNNIRYEAFDFHAECKNMQWYKLSILIDKISLEQDKFGYFITDKNNKILSLQEGVFRTNCIDCLDRTNVVQSMIAWRNLSIILRQFGILNENKPIIKEENFYHLFQSAWADHADCISTQYSGTGALKTDYTRTGKRTYLGILKDGFHSILRYYKNNLKDGFRQDSIDLLLGNYGPKEEECVTVSCPLRSTSSWKSIAFEMIFLFAVAMFFANATFPAEYSTSTWLSIIFWGMMVIITLGSIIYYGADFVNYPKLCPLDVKRIDFFDKFQI